MAATAFGLAVILAIPFMPEWLLIAVASVAFWGAMAGTLWAMCVCGARDDRLIARARENARERRQESEARAHIYGGGA